MSVYIVHTYGEPLGKLQRMILAVNNVSVTCRYKASVCVFQSHHAPFVQDRLHSVPDSLTHACVRGESNTMPNDRTFPHSIVFYK